MSRTYTLTYEVSDDLLKRAMTSWARPKKKGWHWVKVLLVAVAIGAVIGVVSALTNLFDRITPDFLFGALVGFYAGLAFWLVMHKRDLRRLSGFSSAQLQKQGPVEAEFADAGVTMRTRLVLSTLDWQSYDQVTEMGDAVALRSGALIYPVPYSALPQGVTPAEFHADLTAWVGGKA